MDISTLGSCVAIVMICYIVGMGCKASKRISDEWIPVIMAVIGGILGAVGMGIIPDFPATDYITAVAGWYSRPFTTFLMLLAIPIISDVVLPYTSMFPSMI